MYTLTTHTPAMLMRDYITRYASERAFSLDTWYFKIGKLPAEPDQVITLIDQGDVAIAPHLLVDWRGLQILVRSASGSNGYQTSHVMVNAIRDMILGMPGHPPEFQELDGVVERGGITSLGYDDQDRCIWSSNYRLLVEPVTNDITHRSSL